MRRARPGDPCCRPGGLSDDHEVCDPRQLEETLVAHLRCVGFLRSDEEFLSRFGDAIDDRIAEILDELLEERNATRQHRRLPQVLSTVSLILALAASVLLQHSAIAAWTIWPATAVICLAAARTTSNGRSLLV
jgi:hypothetical protein